MPRATTPQQFVESFLKEKAKAWREARAHLKPVFANYFDNALLQHAEQFMPRDTVDTIVENVTQTDVAASVVACERIKTLDLRTRYRLEVKGDGWKIIGIDRMCMRCRGTGQFRNAKCQDCDGEGFRDCTSNTDV